MTATATPAIQTVLDYLNPRPADNSPVGVVWGEGNYQSPYDRESYHAGHLGMLCAVIGMAQKGYPVTVFLTSDHQAHADQGVYGPFYRRRQKEVVDWLQSSLNGAQLSIVDVPEALERAGSSNEWVKAGELFARICKTIEKEKRTLSSGEEKDFKLWAGALASARITDDPAEWNRLGVLAPLRIKSILEKSFSQVAYAERDADISATSYVVSRVLGDEKKWQPDEIRNWVTQCGTVLGQRLKGGVLVESARNMYWLRCLRLLSATNTAKNDSLPNLCTYRNVADRKGIGAMRGKVTDTWVPIFRSPAELQRALHGSEDRWLNDFAVRLTWVGESHPIARDLKDAIENGIQVPVLRNAVFDTISDLTDNSSKIASSSVRVNDWFCISYLMDEFLHLGCLDKWKLDITEAHVLEDAKGDNCYRPVAQKILDDIDTRRSDAQERLFAAAVRKTVEWTDSIDLLLHMMPKRYRDHGRHQLNVAAVADLLWNASAPTKNYKAAVTVAQKTAEAIRGSWQGSKELIRDMSMLASLPHDHGYALQQVAWLLGRLQTMKLKGMRGGVDANAKRLADALIGYVEPFASSWFKNEICAGITKAEESPCDCLSPIHWTARSKGKRESILPDDPNRDAWPGHGLFGAMNLWGLMEDAAGKEIELPSGHRVLQALHAIAAHDDLRVGVSVDKSPLAFMLVIADEIQEWSRRLFYEGESHVESPHAELDGHGDASKYSLQLRADELRVRFFHVGMKKAKVAWEYSLFRKGKLANLERAHSDGELFPKAVTFETAVGP